MRAAARAVLETPVECNEGDDEEEQDAEESDDDSANINRFAMFLSLTGARHDGHVLDVRVQRCKHDVWKT